MKELNNTPEVITMENYRDNLVIFTSTLYLETIYILQILRYPPIGQLARKAFIIICIKSMITLYS